MGWNETQKYFFLLQKVKLQNNKNVGKKLDEKPCWENR